MSIQALINIALICTISELDKGVNTFLTYPYDNIATYF